MGEKNLGLGSVIATGVGLIVATSCLLSLGIGSATVGTTFIISMAIACALNILFALSICELNAIMPNLTGGLAQYSLAGMGPFVSVVAMVGGYLVCNTIVGSSEVAMFGNTMCNTFTNLPIPGNVYSIVLLIVLICTNLRGVDMFAKIQNVVAYSLILSLLAMGIIGMLGLGTGAQVSQPAVLSSNFSDIVGLCGLAFFLFIGAEYVVPISKQVKNEKRNIPLGMIISLVLIMLMQAILVLGFHRYVPWEELGASATPHILYGAALLGDFGTYWMALVSVLAVTSSVNTVISSLGYLCLGMAKIELLPSVFEKTNKKGAPVVGILAVGGVQIIINAAGMSTSSTLSFLILTGCVFWMLCYILTHLNVLILRKRLPKAPRSFKVPFTPIPQIVGAVGTVWMIWIIDSNPDNRMRIYEVCGVILIILAIYAFVWVKFVLKKPLFKGYAVKDVMAMENAMYEKTRERESRLRGQTPVFPRCIK